LGRNALIPDMPDKALRHALRGKKYQKIAQNQFAKLILFKMSQHFLYNFGIF